MLFPGGCCRQGRLPSPCLGSRMLSRPVGRGMLRKEHPCGRAWLKHKFSGFFYCYFSLFQFLLWKRGHQFILLDVTSAGGSAGRGPLCEQEHAQTPPGGTVSPRPWERLCAEGQGQPGCSLAWTRRKRRSWEGNGRGPRCYSCLSGVPPDYFEESFFAEEIYLL